jgi:hypothetical protein
VLADVGAAVFDPRNNIGGLSQLKWQELIGRIHPCSGLKKSEFPGPKDRVDRA